MIEFRINPHIQAGMPAVVEVWVDGRFLATIYGSQERNGKARPVVRVISKHGLEIAHELTGAIMQEARVTITERS